MSTAAQPLHVLPDPRKMDHILLASVGSSHNGCTNIGILLTSQLDMPTGVARYATVGKVDAES
jgi:hypothetical protein